MISACSFCKLAFALPKPQQHGVVFGLLRGRELENLVVKEGDRFLLLAAHLREVFLKRRPGRWRVPSSSAVMLA